MHGKRFRGKKENNKASEIADTKDYYCRGKNNKLSHVCSKNTYGEGGRGRRDSPQWCSGRQAMVLGTVLDGGGGGARDDARDEIGRAHV